MRMNRTPRYLIRTKKYSKQNKKTKKNYSKNRKQNKNQKKQTFSASGPEKKLVCASTLFQKQKTEQKQKNTIPKTENRTKSRKNKHFAHQDQKKNYFAHHVPASLKKTEKNTINYRIIIYQNLSHQDKNILRIRI